MKKEKRKHQLRVCVNDEEKKRIDDLVSEVSSYSVSDYLRTLGLGHEPKSIIDKKYMLELAKVHGDQARLGGLLKMLLTNGEKVNDETIRSIGNILEKIDQVQEVLLQKMEKL